MSNVATTERFGQDVTVRRNCTVAEVARIVESGVDVFHFVGHHDDGLACADGSLSVDALAESNARTFLLNACGSAPFGAGLVRKGSVAGAVTLDPVTDETAVRFGTAFAGLLAGGFPVASAVERARRTLLVPRQYTVVGDGTHLVTDNTGTESAVIDLERLAPGRFRVEQEHWILTNPGGQWVGGLDDTARLKGQSTSNVVSAAELDEFLAAAVPPVLFEGDLHRPSALRAELDLSA